jgi:hypothetical protein
MLGRSLSTRVQAAGRAMPIEVYGAGDPLAVRWVIVPEGDSLELLDPVSGRSATVVRPPADVLAMPDLVRLERLGLAWGNLLTAPEADRELAALVDAGPLPVLTGLSWIIALWCVLCETRTGMSAVDGARTLDYRGERRRTGAPQDERMFDALNQRVRVGVLAALTEDGQAVAAYRQAVTVPENVAPVLARHTLLVMDGFSQDMLRNGLNPRGLIASFADRTGPTTRPRRCFGPAR